MRCGLKFYIYDMLWINEYISKDKLLFIGGLVCWGLFFMILDYNVDILIVVSFLMVGMYGGLYVMLYDGIFVKLEYLFGLIKLFMWVVLYIN